MGHYAPYQTHMLPYTASLLSLLWDRYVFRKNPYLGMIWAMGMVWDDCHVEE